MECYRDVSGQNSPQRSVTFSRSPNVRFIEPRLGKFSESIKDSSTRLIVLSSTALKPKHQKKWKANSGRRRGMFDLSDSDEERSLISQK